MIKEAIQHLINISQTGKIISAGDKFNPVMIQGDTLLSLEKFAQTPYRITEKRDMPSLKAFIDYVNAFRQASTVIFADSAGQTLTALIDYHGKGQQEAEAKPSWCTHQITFKLVKDEDFDHFLHLNKRITSQDDLVIELTDYAQHFIDLTASDVLGLVGDIQVVDAKELASKVGGGAMNTLYKQDKTLKSKSGKDLPEVFKVMLPVFKGVPSRYEVPFRLLWRCGEDTRNKLMFEVRLVRPHAILEAAFQDVCADIMEAVKEVPIYGADVTGTSTAK